jgi:hypothetical protein
MIVRLGAMVRIVAVVDRAMAVVVMVAALAVVAGARVAMGVVPAAAVVAPSAADVLVMEADARHSAVGVIPSGRRLRATRTLAAVKPTAIKAAVPAMVTVRATATANLPIRRDMTRDAVRVMTRGAHPAMVADTVTAAATAMTRDVAVMATVVPAAP